MIAWIAALSVAAAVVGDLHIVHVAPGELQTCVNAAATRPVRCVLAPGVYQADDATLIAAGHHHVEIVGAGSTLTILTGTKPVTDEDVTWTLATNSTTIYKAVLPASLRIPGIRPVMILQSTFLDFPTGFSFPRSFAIS